MGVSVGWFLARDFTLANPDIRGCGPELQRVVLVMRITKTIF